MLWTTLVLHKVSSFMWRACRSVLPTRIQLLSNALQFAWFVMPILRYLALAANLPNQYRMLAGSESLGDHRTLLLENSKSFTNFFFRVYSLLDEERRGMIFMIMWSLWKKRNKKLWNDKDESEFAVVSKDITVLTKRKLAQQAPPQME